MSRHIHVMGLYEFLNEFYEHPHKHFVLIGFHEDKTQVITEAQFDIDDVPDWVEHVVVFEEEQDLFSDETDSIAKDEVFKAYGFEKVTTYPLLNAYSLGNTHVWETVWSWQAADYNKETDKYFNYLFVPFKGNSFTMEQAIKEAKRRKENARDI